MAQTALPFIVNDSPGGCMGQYPGCKRCAAIVRVRAAMAKATANPTDEAKTAAGE